MAVQVHEPISHELPKYACQRLDDSLPSTARYKALCSLASDTGTSRFATGASASEAHSYNLSVFQVQEAESGIMQVASCTRSEGFTFMAGSTFASNQIAIATKAGECPTENVSLMVTPDASSEDALHVRSEVASGLYRVCSILWESPEYVCVADNAGVGLYSVGTSGQEASHKQLLPNCTGAVLDPHKAFTVAACADRSVSLWDTRTRAVSATVKTSHFFNISCLDVNPNVPNIYVTGGDDGWIMFWDIRQTSGSIKSMEAHSHKVTSVKFNPVHDELLLSSGTDCAVNLWRFPSLSRNPGRFPSLMESSLSGQTAHLRRNSVPTESAVVSDGLVQTYTRHEDSVYCACWGGSTWSFASLSYDGLLLINSVPTSERHRV